MARVSIFPAGTTVDGDVLCDEDVIVEGRINGTVLVGGVLLVTTETGDGVLVEPTPEGHRELTRFPLLPGTLWNPPALAAPYLLVRNDEEAACYEVALE